MYFRNIEMVAADEKGPTLIYPPPEVPATVFKYIILFRIYCIYIYIYIYYLYIYIYFYMYIYKYINMI